MSLLLVASRIYQYSDSKSVGNLSITKLFPPGDSSPPVADATQASLTIDSGSDYTASSSGSFISKLGTEPTISINRPVSPTLDALEGSDSGRSKTLSDRLSVGDETRTYHGSMFDGSSSEMSRIITQQPIDREPPKISDCTQCR